MVVYAGWRTSWTLVVPIFQADLTSHRVLLYDQAAGEAELHVADGQGNLTLIKAYSGWRKTWAQIVAGVWTAADNTRWPFLLFYDRSSGEGVFFKIDNQGDLTLVGQQSDWRKSWDQIVPWKFGAYDCSGFLFYDREAGEGWLYRTGSDGSLTPVQNYAGWRNSWALIVPGDFGGPGWTDLLFYDRDAGVAEFYAFDCDGGMALLNHFDDWRKSWTAIAVGNFGNQNNLDGNCQRASDIVLYDRTAGAAAFYSADGSGGMSLIKMFSDWRTSWSALIALGLGFDACGYSDLLLYDSQNGVGEVYVYDTATPWPLRPIEAYASPASVSPGEVLALHVYSQEPIVTLEIFRQGAVEDRVYHAQVSVGEIVDPIPANAVEAGCGWPVAHAVAIRSGWKSGVYIARLQTTTAVAEALFVIKSSSPGQNATVLLELPVTTYQAYNYWGGRSLYGSWQRGLITFDFGRGLQPDQSPPDPPARAFKVSFDRPYASLHDFRYLALPFIQWMERRGIALDFCTSIDLHSDSDLVSKYRLLISVGHDEYWSREMRDNVSAFVRIGRNVAFFSGNVCWWQVRFDQNNRTMICYKDTAKDPLWPIDPALTTTNWGLVPGTAPDNMNWENMLTGVSFYNGCGEPAKVRCSPRSPYVVQREHWVFQNTDLTIGGQFGVGPNRDSSIVANELDGMPNDAGTQGTPPGTLLLATADVSAWNGQGNFGTMITYDANGTVFNAATTNWSRGLTTGTDPTPVDQITRNVLATLGS
jgi:hypothetical protein